MSDESTKRCGHCKKEKFLWQFYKNKSLADGVSHYCKECQNLSVAKTRARKTNVVRSEFYRLWTK